MEEIWKDVVGYEELYKVSNIGNIKSFARGVRVLKCSRVKGYLMVRLPGNKLTYVHRIVLFAFVPNPENKPCVNHINGIKDDNRLENLEWCTHKENSQHATKTGLNIAASLHNHPRTKLTNEDVLDIFSSKLSYKELAEKHNTAHHIIDTIKSGRNWSKLTGKAKNKKVILSKDTVISIFYDTGSLVNLAKKYNTSPMTVCNIKNKKSHSLVTANL